MSTRRHFVRVGGCTLAAALWMAGCGDGRDTPAEPEHDLISFHWPAEQPDSDVRMCVVAATGQQIALDPDPIIATRDIERAFLANPDDGFVTVRLTPRGRALLAEATSARIGERLAIVVEDQVVALPVIRQSLDVAELPLMPQQSPAAADSLAARINSAIAQVRS